MGCLLGSRLAMLLQCILVWSGCSSVHHAGANEAPRDRNRTFLCDDEVACAGYDMQQRELQNASNQSVVKLAVLFDVTKTFAWAQQLLDFTFMMINDHTDGWHDELFPDGTIVDYRISDPVCDETAAAKAYWDIRNEWGGFVHGVVGCRCSGASIAVGRITNLDNVPQVSPSSTSPKLGDKDDFPLFSRLVGPAGSEGEIGAMVAMLRSFGWDRVTIIGMDTQYAKDYTTSFEELWKGNHQEAGSKPWEGKVAYSSTITFDTEGRVDADSVTAALDGVPTDDPNKNSRVVLLVADVIEAYPVLQMAGELGFQPDTIWVGPQSWVGRLPPNGTAFDMPTYPGYIGLTPFRNRDSEYQTFLERLQAMQRANGLDVMTELPDYTAEFLVDSILALVKALSAIPSNSHRNGSLVTSVLRNLTFQGVSGQVSFTQEGDRRDPLYTIFNMQILDGTPKWVEVGSAGTSWSKPELDKICFAVAGCNAESFPSDKYPVPAKPIETWVIVVIAILGVLLIAVLLKYWRSRRKKANIKLRLMEIDDELCGIDGKVKGAKQRQARLMQKRAALTEKPVTWSASDQVLVEVLPRDPQYWKVCKRLKEDMNDAHISKLWRIQNISLWTYYSFHRDRLEMNKIDHNEKSVWHGTSKADPSIIYDDRQDGFMMQYSQSGLWGRGIYFAAKSSYSNSYAYNPLLGASGLPPSSIQRPRAVDGEREMFLTKLLVGKEVLMNRDESALKAAECKKLIIPPTDPITNLKYNTVSGYSGGSQVWVVYENGRAYPDYLVRYYRGSRDPVRTPFENEVEAKREPAKKRTRREGPLNDAPDIETGIPVRGAWDFLDDDGWKPYADQQQVELETAFQSFAVTKTSSSNLVRIHAGRWGYEIDFAKMVQKNIQHPNHRERAVRRRLVDESGIVS